MMTRRSPKSVSAKFARMRCTDEEKKEIKRMGKLLDKNESDVLRYGMDLVRAELARRK